MSVRRILGLDLGTNTGWCRMGDGYVAYGEWGFEGGVVNRALGFRAQLGVELEARPDLVVYEEVLFVVSRQQISIWTALATVLRLACYDAGVPLVPVAPGTLKKFATGNGHAKKPEMVAAANEYLEGLGHEPIGKTRHDVADAIHLARYVAAGQLKQGRVA
jgi:Holliday junction resolvasome RuvABC endonuclease subunit